MDWWKRGEFDVGYCGVESPIVLSVLPITA